MASVGEGTRDVSTEPLAKLTQGGLFLIFAALIFTWKVTPADLLNEPLLAGCERLLEKQDI